VLKETWWGDVKMERNVVIIVVLVALVLISVVQAAEIASVKSRIAGNTVGSIQSNDDGGGESQAEMMARMHPELATSKSTSSSGSQGTMVGGC